MNKLIYALADVMSLPAAFMGLTGTTLFAIAIGIAFPMSELYWTGVNLAISVTTMAIGQAVLVSGRRDSLAYHLKLDRLVEALPTDNEPIGIEHEEESTIQNKITETEERAK